MQRFDTLNPINHNLARPIVFMFYDDDDDQQIEIYHHLHLRIIWSRGEQQTSF